MSRTARGLLAAALTAVSVAAFAAEGGGDIEFPNGLKIAGSGAFWESGTSKPAGFAFDRLLLQGRSTKSVAIEGCVVAGEECAWTAAQIERFSNGRFWGTLSLSGNAGAMIRLRSALPASVEIFSVEGTSQNGEPPRSGGYKFSSGLPKTSPVPLSDAPKPEILSRAEWGAAKASKRYEPMVPVRISVHHTEAEQPMSKEDAIQELRAIQRFHQHGRGWIDIAYQYLIDGSGRIWEGRPVNAVGAHVLRNNEGNVGISLMGSFQKPKNMKPTDAQIASLIRLARWLTATYGISPDDILGHRDQEKTQCPGDNLWALLDGVRKAVAARTPRAKSAIVPAQAAVPAGLQTTAKALQAQ